MRRKLWSVLLAAALGLSVMAGCGAETGNQGGADAVDTQVSEGGAVSDGAAGETDGSQAADGSDGAGAAGTDGSQASTVEVAYQYEQPLNIVDDNYRNYYEIFVYSFYDSDGDGIGDLKGITEKLDYIADLGFNGIWLMPVMPSPTYHKYDVTDYKAIDEAYGTMEDFEGLVEGCHERGIRLIIDLVINHSSSGHPWFQEACDYLGKLPDGQEPDVEECPYVDYYHFSREKVSSTYYPVKGSSWYYEGSFWSEMPDLNLDNKALRAEIEDIAAFWIGKGVDGFRMDAAMHYDDEDAQANLDALHWLFEYCQELNPDFYMVSEVWASIATIASYYGSGTPSMFNFDVSSAEGKLAQAAMGSLSADQFVDAMLDYHEQFSALNPDYIDAPFLTNHDQVRIANNLRSDLKLLKTAAGLLMTMNGSPFVYYGEEIGMNSSGTKDENKRLPMNWSASEVTGMTSGPPDADSGIEQSFPPVDEQQGDSLSLWNYYKRALRIRNENPELARGEAAKVEGLCDGELAAIMKTWEGSTIGVVYNLADEEASAVLSGTELEPMAIRGYLTPDGEEVRLEDGKLLLPPRSICILK